MILFQDMIFPSFEKIFLPGGILQKSQKFSKFSKSYFIRKNKRLWEKMLKSSSCPMILSQDIIFQSVKFWLGILISRGNIQNSKKICEISEITYHMKEEENTRSIIQQSWMPDDYSLEIWFSQIFLLGNGSSNHDQNVFP